MMRYLGLGLACFAFAACTVENPLYSPDPRDLSGTGGPVDLAGDKRVDLAGPMTSADFAVAKTCTAGQRDCVTSSSNASSLRCEGGVFVSDRACPQMSMCADGYCKPPPSGSGTIGKTCAPVGAPSETLCTNNGGSAASQPSCQPFVTEPGQPGAAGVSWVCAPPVGSGLPGAACSMGSQCRTGFCGSNGTCFRSCTSELECPTQGTWACKLVSITVEGRSIDVKSCVPM